MSSPDSPQPLAGDEVAPFQERISSYMASRREASSEEAAQRLAAAAAQERQVRSRRILAGIAAAGLALLLLTATAVAVRVIVLPEWQVRAAVTAYFDALERQSWVDIERVIDPESRRQMQTVTIGREAAPAPAPLVQLVSRAYEPPRDIEVETVQIDGDRATATLSFRITPSTSRHDGSLQLRRADGRMADALSRWVIEDPLATLDLHLSGPVSFTCRDADGNHSPMFCLSLNDLPVADMTGVSGHSLPVLPGRHQAMYVAPRGLGLDYLPRPVVVPPGGTGYASWP